MATKQANQIVPGDVISRFGYPVRITSAKPSDHPIGGTVIELTYVHDVAGEVSINFMPEAAVETVVRV